MNPQPANRFRFTGEELDDFSGLYYLRSRWYDPRIRRFLGRDPIDSAPNYTYASNDPVNLTDPTGLFTIQVGLAAGTSFFGFVAPQGGVGIAVDSRLNVGTYAVAGGGVAAGASADVGVSVQFSNADNIYQLAGPSIFNVSFHASPGIGPNASLDYFKSLSSTGDQIITGVGFTCGEGAGASLCLARTTTKVCSLDRTHCEGPLANGLSALLKPAEVPMFPTSVSYK
jgi:RHS repeat-associated protein